MKIEDYINFPRPQFRRDDFYLLDGEWKVLGQTVKVPYPLQSKLSGFEGEVPCKFIYEREFEIPKSFLKERIILHFGAVDQCSNVSINGKKVGEHRGGYNAFQFDITDYVHRDRSNTITVEVEDYLNSDYPYGKQTNKPGGMWYTPVSGIWKSVWIENVPDNYITGYKIKSDVDRVYLELMGLKAFHEARIEINLTDKEVMTVDLANGNNEIVIPNPINWSVDNPHLYEFRLSADKDVIEGYFALRTIAINQINGVNRVCLNGKPIFMHGVLDQGYFQDGIYTPKSHFDYVTDIINIKKLGFNMLRKHIKIEPMQFYYACDVLGMLVVQDMVNSGKYSFIRDTVLPTIGIKRRKVVHLSEDNLRKNAFISHVKETVDELYNSPSVIVYTVFNEGWGQFDADDMYDYVKSLDDTRLIDTASGWFLTSKTDFDSPHIYFRNAKLKPQSKPMLLSECGGYKYMIKDHYFWNKEYGYGRCKNSEELTKRIEQMYELMVIPAIKNGLCGCVYTQLSDVEGEINGIYTYDRAVCKVDKEIMLKIAARINESLVL